MCLLGKYKTQWWVPLQNSIIFWGIDEIVVVVGRKEENTTFGHYIKENMDPDWCGWKSSYKAKHCWFDSQLSHMPRLWVQSPVGVHTRGNQSMFLSHIDISLLFLSSFLSLKQTQIKMYIHTTHWGLIGYYSLANPLYFPAPSSIQIPVTWCICDYTFWLD